MSRKKLFAFALAVVVAFLAGHYVAPAPAEAGPWVKASFPGLPLPPVLAPVNGRVLPAILGLGSSPGNCNDTWTTINTPAVATQATATKAAGATGVRHVAIRAIISFSSGATAGTPQIANLRDGATGAGTVLATWTIGGLAPNATFVYDSGPNLFLLGSGATAMTLEYAAAGPAATQENVTLVGLDVQ